MNLEPRLGLISLGLVLLLGTAACTSVRPGVVRMKVDDTTAHVALEQGQAEVGDSIALIESRCPRGPTPTRTRKPASDKCRRVVVGIGAVTELLNDQYSVVKFPSGLTFEEGDAVQVYQPDQLR